MDIPTQKEMTNNELGQMIAEYVDKKIEISNSELAGLIKGLETKIDGLEDIFVSKDEFRQTMAEFGKKMRDGFDRMDKRFDTLELNYGPRLAQVEGRLLTVKDVIQNDLGAKVSWQ